ncbi:hypothetical protein EON65_40970, partial [archaeon]
MLLVIPHELYRQFQVGCVVPNILLKILTPTNTSDHYPNFIHHHSILFSSYTHYTQCFVLIGFEPLSLVEVKKDCKEMEKASAFMVCGVLYCSCVILSQAIIYGFYRMHIHHIPCTLHHTLYTIHYTLYTIYHTPYIIYHTPYIPQLPRGHLYKEDEFLSGIELSFTPAVSPENSVVKKFQRIKSWEESMKTGIQEKPYEKDLQFWHEKIRDLRERRRALEREREGWQERGDNLRNCLLSATEEVRRDALSLEAYLPSLRNLFFSLFRNEEGRGAPPSSSLSAEIILEILE